MLSQGYRSISKYSQGHRDFAQGHLMTSQGHRIQYFERIFGYNSNSYRHQSLVNVIEEVVKDLAKVI